jgi:uncharacterized protein (TIGR02679 family)
MTTSTAGRWFPGELHRYLADDSLASLWEAVRTRLERNGLSVGGQVTVTLDERGADRLGGLLAIPVRPGEVKIRLPTLDAALRRSAAAAGLVTVTGALTGGPLVDRRARRAAHAESWGQVWDTLDAKLAAAGLVEAPWIPAFIEAVRRSGLLTRAGIEAARTSVEHAAAVLGELVPHGPLTEPAADAAEPRWELAELAGRCTDDAHGLDDGRLTSALVLRAAAVALDEPIPNSAAARRELWAQLGVVTNLISGTVLVWGLRPTGLGRWAAMMRDRADQQLVTHLTLYELRGAAAGTALAAAGQQVHACENPQVLQAAARADCRGPLVCFSGNPASAGWLLLRGLLEASADIRYHGDFDWPGMAIAGRVVAAGAAPWRLSASDYDDAVTALQAESQLALTGSPVQTSWDNALAARMRDVGLAVHEESLLPTLLADLRRAPR